MIGEMQDSPSSFTYSILPIILPWILDRHCDRSQQPMNTLVDGQTEDSPRDSRTLVLGDSRALVLAERLRLNVAESPQDPVHPARALEAAAVVGVAPAILPKQVLVFNCAPFNRLVVLIL